MRRIVLGAFVVALTCGGITVPPCATAIPAPDILAKFDSLEIKGRAPKTGYSRSQFGDSWTDDVSVPGGRNGCDTRFLGGFGVLHETLQEVGFKQGTLR